MSNTEEYVAKLSHDIVKESVLGQELTDEQCKTLGKIITVRGLKEGDYLFNEGDVDDTLYVIVKGGLEALRASGGGDLASLYIAARRRDGGNTGLYRRAGPQRQRAGYYR